MSVRGPRTAWADAAAEDYGRRIGRYFPFEEHVLRAGDAADAARRTLAVLPSRGRLVVLDERGVDRDSLAFAALVGGAADDGVTGLVFALGGPYGHDPGLRARADVTVRLSALVMNHAVARVVVLEQLYRACTIRAGEPYHHA